MHEPEAESVCKVLVVDDEPLARMRLRGMLEALQGFVCVGEAGNGQQALQAQRELQPDIVLMDIRMPGVDGLEAAQQIAELAQPPAVIFCTAYDEHAMQAFEASATAYLLKPIKLPDLERALQKAAAPNRAQLSSLRSADAAEASRSKYLRVKTARGEERIALADVRAMVADNKYVSAYTDQRELILDQSLRSLEAEYKDFLLRVHRNALVARAHVTGLEKLSPREAEAAGAQHCVLLAGCSLRPAVSRRHLADLRKLLRES